jgi:tetratricopeptide (TPR) repeat protein
MSSPESPEPEKRFCASCGTALPADAHFCAGCGKATPGGKTAKTVETSGSATGRNAGLAVLAIFCVVGAGLVYTTSQEKGPSARAVPGAPTPAPGTPATGNLPSGHPQIEVPQEIVDFLATLEKAAEENPEDIEAWQKLGRARYRASLIDRRYVPATREALAHVIELDPDNLEAVRTYGNLAYDTGDYPQARKHFERYLELDPANPAVKTDLASTILFMGDRETAKRLYREILEKNPSFPQAHVNLGIALHTEGKTEEGMASLERARELVTTDEQRAQIDRVIAAASGHTPPARPAADAAPAPAAQAMRPAPSNAQTTFQREADKVFLAHSIVGPRVAEIDWTGESSATVALREFPMDKMPAVMRNKFKSNMNESLSRLAEAHDVDTAIEIALVDSTTKDPMDKLDGKEWVGAFDEENYQ